MKNGAPNTPPSIALSWRRAWQEVIPFFAFLPDVGKIIYTTNAPYWRMQAFACR